MSAQDRPLPSLQILETEMEAYRQTGEAIHLPHAARALDDVRAELQKMKNRALAERLQQGRAACMSAASTARLFGWIPPLDDAPSLDKDESADAVVVESGIAGTSVAYELASTGKGMNSRTSASHSPVRCRFDKLSRRVEDIAKF